MRRAGILAAMAAIALFAAGCAGSRAPAVEVEIRSEAMAFDQAEITVRRGESVRLVLNNTDVLLHDWSVAKIPSKVTKQQKSHGGHSMTGPDPDLHVSADGNRRETIEFTPLEPGTYEFYCAVIGHKEAGMVGRLVVQ